MFSSLQIGRPAPKEPAEEWIAAIIETKQRNPKRGWPRTARRIVSALTDHGGIGAETTKRVLGEACPARLR